MRGGTKGDRSAGLGRRSAAPETGDHTTGMSTSRSSMTQHCATS